MALKVRICKTLGWEEFPDSGDLYKSFKVHNLGVLLHLSGIEKSVRRTHSTQWSVVSAWNPETRYRSASGATKQVLTDMIAATEQLLEKIL